MTLPGNLMGAHGAGRRLVFLLGMAACLLGELPAEAQPPPNAARREPYSPTTWRRVDTPVRHAPTQWTVRVPAPNPIVLRDNPLLTATPSVWVPVAATQADAIIPAGHRDAPPPELRLPLTRQDPVPARLPPVELSHGGQPQPKPAKVEEPESAVADLLQPPTRNQLFRLDTEKAIRKRMITEAALESPPQVLTFPEAPVLPADAGKLSRQPGLVRLVEPVYVCHDPLLFEERNSERYGWDLGIIQPFVSTGHFYGSTALLPWELMTAARRRYECTAGLYLPGTPIPYRWYLPRGWSGT